MPITTIDIVNPRLAQPAYDFRSVTEYKDLPRKYLCLDDEAGNALYGTSSSYYCQEGCDEKAFAYIVEPGDIIPLQFQAPDSVNADPANPVVGWYTGGSFLIRLEVVSMDGDVLWDGDLREISGSFHVGVTEFGPVQNVNVHADRLLDVLDGVNCFFFRAKVNLGVGDYGVVNDETAPANPEIGQSYIDFGSGEVREWNGTGWTVIGPDEEKNDYWYVASTGAWYLHGAGGWQGVSGPPPADEGAFDALTTMAFRFRACNEPVVHFSATHFGRDCAGFIHELPSNPLIVLPNKLSAFYWSFKVAGSMEVDALPIQRELTKNGRLVNVALSTSARVRTTGMPEAVAKAVQAVLTSKTFYIDGKPWTTASDVRKNNEDGLHWWLDLTVTREDCNEGMTCD